MDLEGDDGLAVGSGIGERGMTRSERDDLGNV